MPGKHAPESSASFIISLSRAVGGALAAVAVMSILVVALLDRSNADDNAGPAISSPSPPTQTATSSPTPPTVSPSPTPSVLAPSKVTVQVLNGGTGRTGLAAATAQEIEKAGYKLAGTGNTAKTEKSSIFYRTGRRAEALAFQEKFPDFTVLKEAPSSQTAFLRVVLGSDWPEQT